MVQAGENDPTRNSFNKNYMPLVEIKDFNVLINNKPIFKQPIKTIKKSMKNLPKCQEAMTKQQELITLIRLIMV